MQAGLLALDLACVAREVALPLEQDAEVRVHLDERAGDAVANGAGLAGRPAAVHAHAQVVLALELGTFSGELTITRWMSRGKYSSIVLPLIQVLPSPGRRITRATDVLRFPVPRYWAG